MKRFGILCSALLIWSCSSDEELLKVKRDIASLQEQVYKLESANQASQQKIDETLQQIHEMLDDRTGLADQQEQMRSMRNSLAELEARMADVERRAGHAGTSTVRATPSSTTSSEPGDDSEPREPDMVSGSDVEIQFKTSYGDFARGKYQLAAYGFEELLNNFPTSAYTEQCYYYLGRCYYETKEYQKANTQFGTLVGRFPDGNFTRQSMFYQGKCYYYLNMHNKAILRLRELVEKFPGTQEAELARSFMQKAGYEN